MQKALNALAADLADSPAALARGTCSDLSADGSSPQRSGLESSNIESGFAELLADVVQVERVPVDSNFFDDLRCGLDGDGPVLCSGEEAA